MGRQEISRERKCFLLRLACCMTMMVGLVGCIPPTFQKEGAQDLKEAELMTSSEEYETSTLEMLKDAESKMGRGDYETSEQETLMVLKAYRGVYGDRALFQLGLLYAHPENPKVDYGKSVEYFERILREFPLSEKKEEARIWILTLRSREEESEQHRKRLKTMEQAAEAKEKKVKNLREEVEERDKRLNEMENELGQINSRVMELEAQMAKFKNVDLTIEKKKRTTLP
jgi:MarR-like DNA-binding transcriptional regulator SgrR of sgrS sRNA